MTYTGTIRGRPTLDGQMCSVLVVRLISGIPLSSGFEESITLSFEFVLWEEVEVCVLPWPWDKDWSAGVQQWEFFTAL